MKVQDLFERQALLERPTYDTDFKVISGNTKEWLDGLKATADDIKAAVVKAKELPSYKALTDVMRDISTPKTAANGSFYFEKEGADRSYKYLVYATGQLRSQSNNEPTRLASPKPRVKAGDPVGSIVMMLDGGFKALAKTAARRSAAIAKGQR